MDEKLRFITEKPVFLLGIIGVLGLLIRLYYFPYEIPLILDALDYLSYALVTSQNGHFPHGWNMSTNGWPSVLSVFFALFSPNSFFDYIYIQRSLTVAISVLTIIPMYLLGTRFFEKPYAMLCAVLFILDPRLITNSLLGTSDPLFYLLGITALFFFLSNNIKSIYASFGIAALLAIIRYEGLLILLPLSIVFFMRFGIKRNSIQRYLLSIGIVVLILLPIAYLRIEATGNDGLISHVIAGPEYVSKYVVQGLPDAQGNIVITDGQNTLPQFVMSGISNIIKYFGWVLVPTFVFFIVSGLVIIVKKRSYRNIDYKIKTVIICTIVFLIPAFYAYGRDFQETRYLYMLFPIFALLSIYTIRKIGVRFTKTGIISALFIVGVLVASVGFLDYEKIDYGHEREAFLITKHVANIAKGVNTYSPEIKYIKAAEVSNNWPELPPPDPDGHLTRETARISAEGHKSLDEYIRSSKDQGLTHLVLDGRDDREKFLNDVYFNEKKYPYLTKVYDSAEFGFTYHVKIYQIDYNKFQP